MTKHQSIHNSINTTGVILASVVLLLFGCSSNQQLATVDQVVLDKYEGRWFEVARLPQRFEENCACVTAAYEQMDEEYVTVKNTCFDTLSQETRISTGKAFPVEGSNNSKLKVQFFFPFKGDYYIIDLDSNYQYALVGAPSRENLWLLSRVPALPPDQQDRLLKRAKAAGFDTTKLIYTDHSKYCNHSTQYP